MTKIFDLINFHTAYGSQVRLHDHYYDDEENRSRLGGYMPISAHRVAFQSLAKAQLPDPNNKDKVFMLTGSFGTGKSHLCLMLANYFSQKIDSATMKPLFANWAKRDPEGANFVQNIRGEGRYLVAICEFGTGKPFEDMLLSAIEEALKLEGADEIALNSQFKGVLRQIEDWEERRKTGDASGAYADFLGFLAGEDGESELIKLKKELQANSSKALDKFQDAYQKAIGQRFNMQNDSLNSVLEDMLRNPDFKSRYRGLVVLADEFGYALGEGKIRTSVFQSFAEMSKDGVNGVPIIFVGVLHRRFQSYANSSAVLDFQVVKDRVTEVSLESEELEQIIAALVSPKKEALLWKNEIQGHWLLSRMANETTKFTERKMKLFEYLREPDLLEQIVRNIYPMHPLAVFCLTKMSQELGSATRSVFSFFRQNAGEGSYVRYIESQDYKKADGSLNIYTPDMLVKYFEPDIAASAQTVRETIRDHIRNYRAALEEVTKQARATFTGEVDPFIQQVLDVMFVFKVSGVPLTASNLCFGLNFYNPEEKKKLGNALDGLRASKVIFLGSSGEFEFRRSDMEDVEALIKEQLQIVENQPLDAADRIVKIAESLFNSSSLLLAQDYNSLYQDDKRMRLVFATPQDLLRKFKLLDKEISYWDFLDNERRGQKTWQERYEGVMVYVLCENEDDIQNAQQAAKSNHATTILVGVPRNPVPVREKILNYQAVRNFMDDHKYEKLDSQEKALVGEIHGIDTKKSGRIGDVIKVREQYLNGQGLIWYQQDGKVLVSQPKTAYEPADALFNALYTKRNTVDHNILNLAHPTRFTGAKDNALRDAVSRLVDYGKPVEIDVNENKDRGEIRYLRNVLANLFILKKNKEQMSSIAFYELDPEIAAFQNKLPALFEIVSFLRGIGQGQKENVWPKLQLMTEAPYGIGPFALSLFWAVAIRYLGDELKIKLQPNSFGYAQLTDPETVIGLAIGQYPTATVERIEKTPAMTALVDGTYLIFSETAPAAGSHQTQNAAWHSMLNWWKNRTRLERTSGIYPPNSPVQKFTDTMTSLENLGSAAQSFLDELKVVNGYNSDATLDETIGQSLLIGLKEYKQSVENHAKTIKHNVVTLISLMFSPKGNTYLDYSDAIRNWYNELHNDQKDKNAKWQTGLTKTLVEALGKVNDVEKLFLVDISASPAFNIGKVDDWSYDRTNEYTEKVKTAKDAIDNGLPKLPAPEWQCSQAAGDNPNDIRYNTKVNLTITAPPGVIVRVARDADPILAKEFEVIGEGLSKTFEVTDSRTYAFVSNSAGDFSKVIQVKFRNKDDDYKPIPEKQIKMDPKDRFYSFRNPVDQNSLMVFIGNLIDQIKQDGLMTEEEITLALRDAILSHLKKD